MALAGELNDALTRNDAKAAEKLFSYDAAFEDVMLPTTVQGPPAIGRYVQPPSNSTRTAGSRALSRSGTAAC
ncbi:hypothetical protein ACF1HJ_28235 [Streptomyces sp. NPDC013978]|uniref:hypothetical protein n=1 Tax=Streptomyces sp. NPDC013978 TaxID=3364869 RepID=UPI0036FE755D